MGVALGDKVQLRFYGQCYSQRIIFGMDYLVTQAAAPGDTYVFNMTSLINDVDVGGVNTIVPEYLVCLNTDYTLLKITAQVVKPVRLAYVAKNVARPASGGVGNVANDSACLTLRTPNSGRDQVANKHIGPIPDSVSISGRLDIAYKAVVAGLGDKLIVPIQPVALGPIYAPVIYHRFPDTTDIITSFIVGDQSRVQRRRTVGVGE